MMNSPPVDFKMRKELTDNELEIYSRQVVLSDIGYDGQVRLKNAKVCIVGLGGLGAPSALKLAGMGSTLTAVVFNKNRLYFAHVGDSRGYIIHKDSIAQFTEDHSYVASLVKAGVITEEEAKNHPDDNIITRAIGIEKNLLVDSAEWHEKLKKNQYILICCDGLYKVVTDEEILEMVNKYPAPDAICEKLVEKANENGGPDNITVMAARINKTGLISDLFNR
jgi:serine/threonine protein phosphatase PrpC